METRVKPRRIGVFGWGIVAPRSPNVDAFAANLDTQDSWLRAFEGFGPSNFLVGDPDFRFTDYKGWIDERFPPTRFPQLEKKMGMPVQYAIGAFIQSLQQNPGLERELQALGPRAHVYIGTGLGDLPTMYSSSLEYYRGQRRWNRFWADPERNAELRAHLKLSEAERAAVPNVPPAPESAPAAERDLAEDAWWSFWAARSSELAEYLRELREIEGLSVEGDVESAKLTVIKEKRTRAAKLQKKFGAPEVPWNSVSANLLWNIHNTPASQISMMGKITGMTYAPVAACSSFGYALKLAMDAITLGEAKAVVIGDTDPPPHPLSVGAFYQARVLAADGAVSKPLTGLRGTHVAGGAAVWVVGDYEYLTKKGFKPLGMEPVSVGVTADAEHIITPSKEGPMTAIREALAQGGITPKDIGSWDLHATATPGDYLEMETLRGLVGDDVLVTARKGTFGHGMSVGGGWELTAQYLGYQRGKLYPTPLTKDELNAQIGKLHTRFAFDASCDAPKGAAGKLSMGVGGINVCVLSRPLK
jgi:3-oxoacyl-(acyl-carrier-protein) synthase